MAEHAGTGVSHAIVGQWLSMLWSVAFVAGIRAGEGGLDHRSGWFFRAAGTQAMSELATTASAPQGPPWVAVHLPHNFARTQPESNVYGWYVRELAVPPWCRGLDLFAELGLIDDADRTFFNGVEVGRMGGGLYERFRVHGPARPTFRISKHRGPCAVVSGVFLDAVSPLQGSPIFLAPNERGPRDLGAEFATIAARGVALAPHDASLATFRAKCEALTRQASCPAQVYWWMAEVHRLQGDVADHQRLVRGFLRALLSGGDRGGLQDLSPHKRLRDLGDFMLAYNYSNAAMLEVARCLLAMGPRDPEGVVRGFPRGTFPDLALRQLD